MQAYLNDKTLKNTTIAAMKVDVKAEALVQGHYWNGNNGCFVGCVIRGDSHASFELKLGIPRILARLADRIFESLTYADAKKFSVDFLQAIPVGADLSSVWDKFAHFMLVDAEYGVIKFAKKATTTKSIQDIADMYQRKINGEKINANVWLDLRKKAAYAAYAAYADAAYAAAAAAAAYAAYAAYADAAYAAAAAAAAAAYTAAADAADAADAYADAAARSRHFAALATRLVELLREA